MRKNSFLVVCGLLLLILGVSLGRFAESSMYEQFLNDFVKENKIMSSKLSSLKTDLDNIDNDLYVLKEAVGAKKATVKVTPTPTPTPATPTPTVKPKATSEGLQGDLVAPVDNTGSGKHLDELSPEEIQKLKMLLEIIG